VGKNDRGVSPILINYRTLRTCKLLRFETHECSFDCVE